MEKYFPLAFVVLVISMMFGYFLYYRFLIYLKEKHFEKWKELGSPTLFKNNSIQTNLAVIAFLKNKDYRSMGDPELTKKSRFLWNFDVIYLIYFSLTLLLFAFGIVEQ